MPKRALIERRPWLFASILAAVAWLVLQGGPTPGVYLLILNAVPLLLLAVYAALRHRGRDTRMLAGMLVLEGLGSAMLDLAPLWALDVLVFAFLIGLGMFLSHRRLMPDAGRRVGAGALTLLTPALCYFAASRAGVPSPLFYGLALGGMAASAWVSTFPQGRVGLGAVLIVVAQVIGLVQMGAQDPAPVALLVDWALFYLGNLILATGVTGELRLREDVARLD